MSKLMIALFAIAGLAFATATPAQTPTTKTASVTMSKDSFTTAKSNADAQYKVDKNACGSLSGNAKDICMAEAKGKDEVAKADAEAAYQNTPKARQNARIALADAHYRVATEKCDDLAGNTKDVCIKEAKAALVKGKADAKVDRVTADARQESAVKQAEAGKEAKDDKREADYKVAIEKCDALAGPAKDACVNTARTQFGKS
jgi:hypothetical protein